MMARRKRLMVPLVLAVVVPLAIAASWYAWWVLRPPSIRPPLTATLTLVRFADLPGWANADLRPALQAFVRSCGKLSARPALEPMGASGYAGTAANWQKVCGAAGHAIKQTEPAIGEVVVWERKP